MIVVNEFVTTLVIDSVVVASTLDDMEASTLEGLHGNVRIGVPDTGADGVAAADESGMEWPGWPGTDDAISVGETVESGAEIDPDGSSVMVKVLSVLEGLPIGPV